MIRNLMLRVVLFVLVLGLARTAQADVRPPVDVFIAGQPRAAVKGQPYEGILQFQSTGKVALSNLSIRGTRWSVESNGGLLASMQAGEKVEIAFRLVPDDPLEPFIVTYDVDGETIEKYFDVSPEATRRITEPGKTAVRGLVDPLALPPADGVVRVAPAVSAAVSGEAQARRLAGQPARGADERATARNIRVRGRFLYTRSGGVNIGADGVTVKIWDNDSPFGPELLAIVSTDAQGWYDATFFWNPCVIFCDAEPDIYVEFRSENSEYSVRNNTSGAAAYFWTTGTTNDYTGTDLDMGWLWPGAEADQPALHVLTNLTRGWRYHVGQGRDMTSINAFWPDGPSGAWYNGSVHFGTSEQWVEGTIIHEQGHHWVANYGIAVSPDYCNGICDSPSCGHCVWCQETDHDAWAEGFPNWLGELIPGTYLGTYGNAPLSIADGRYTLESLGSCGATDDPYRTENFLGALLHDVVDTPSDDHDAGDLWRDRLALGINPIFTIADFDGPTTPANFLTKFVARYPGYKEQFWETAKNCGYDFDATAPGAVSGLGSSSHTAGGNSPDPTVDFYWTRASDDASGISGYGLFISTTGSVMPGASQNIADVTSWSSSTLAPGTYWFNIRAVDRAGRWSTTYATFGPFTIRTPVPANLTSITYGGWAAPLVPRPAADAVVGSVPAPASLVGNACSTYWNTTGWNSGESSTGAGFQSRLYVDDVWHWWFGWGAIGASGSFYGLNGGPLCIAGGRHTFEVVYDAIDEIAETNEADNGWAHQWVWSPLSLTPGTVVARSAPPLRTAGWSSVVDGSPLYYNSDGFRFTSSGWWNAITLRPVDEARDYDLRLHSVSTGATNGFDSYLQWSSNVGALDALFVNRNVVGSNSYDVSAINWDGGSSDFVIEQVISEGVALGPVYTRQIAADESMDLYEFYVGTAGPISMVVQITDGNPDAIPLKLRWLDQPFTTGALSSYPGTAVTDVSGLGRIDANITTTGYHCLVVYREPGTGAQPLNYTVRIQVTPPDYLPYLSGGWYAPFVPRNAPDGTGVSVPAPATLTGDVASTYFNFSNINQSPSPGAAGLYQQAYLDGDYGWWLAWGIYGSGTVGQFNWGAPWTVRGGRHTLATILDPDASEEEISETNNAYGAQWVWTPSTLALNMPVARSAPSDVTGGWDQGTSGILYWNADGVRSPYFTPGSGYWGAVALMPQGPSDFDPRLHEVSTGAQDGFAAALTQSAFFGGQSDYVLANFNLTGFRAFDVGVVRYGSGTDNYVSEAVGAPYLGYVTSGRRGPFTVSSNSILNLHEVYLTAGMWEINQIPVSGDVDWGLTLHPADQPFLNKATAVAGGLSWLNGPTQFETVIADITIPGYYCIGVWKAYEQDLWRTGSYELQFNNTVLDVPAEGNRATAFRGAFPNPVQSETRLEFELASEGSALLEIFDLNGARVRTLVQGRLSAGTHSVMWSGDDDHGRAVHAGVYYARFAAGGVDSRKKLVRLE